VISSSTVKRVSEARSKTHAFGLCCRTLELLAPFHVYEKRFGESVRIGKSGALPSGLSEDIRRSSLANRFCTVGPSRYGL